MLLTVQSHSTGKLDDSMDPRHEPDGDPLFEPLADLASSLVEPLEGRLRLTSWVEDAELQVEPWQTKTGRDRPGRREKVQENRFPFTDDSLSLSEAGISPFIFVTTWTATVIECSYAQMLLASHPDRLSPVA